jgi:transposase-like protein
VEGLLGQDEAFIRTIVKTALQEVLEAEMVEAVGAGKGERTASRLGYRSGYYGRTLITRVGKLELRVPQDREGRFSTELFERYQRSERALVAALAEMYVQGVSTRKVKAITEELCGHSFSASSISAINKRLDESLAQFADRRLSEAFPYLILDARYEKGGRDHEPSGTDRHRRRLGRPASGSRGRVGLPGEPVKLAGLPNGSARARAWWR